MKKRSFTAGSLVMAGLLVFALSIVALADTIRLRDGSVIRGQIVAFRDQQFTVLIGAGARGRRSRITLYMEDIESIEFDAAGGTTAAEASPGGGSNNDEAETNRPPVNTRPTDTRPPSGSPGANSSRANQTPSASSPDPSASPQFFQVNVRVRADSTANGWTNSGLVVRRGQRLRVTSSGRVSLGSGRFSTPTGLPRIADDNKLMRNEPTGGLIAVIGDDNDDFIFLGSNREFVAQRDGIFFLGLNESNLSDNTGTYDTVIEAEALASATTR